MSLGLVGKKVGMTRVFNEDGVSTPVTVLLVEPNRITQVRESAIQVTTGAKKEKHLNKAAKGHFAKSNVEAGRGLWEFRTPKASERNVGDELTVSIFEGIEKVDVTGTSKGKGFQGAVKRWNFKTQDATHGNSLSHRAPGSIGQNQTPGRVFKGKKMAGHMGNVKETVQNLSIVKIDSEMNTLLVKGAVPGAPGDDVIIKPAVKIQHSVELV